jgi:hypothetical protein
MGITCQQNLFTWQSEAEKISLNSSTDVYVWIQNATLQFVIKEETEQGTFPGRELGKIKIKIKARSVGLEPTIL